MYQIQNFTEIITDSAVRVDSQWQCQVIQSAECLSYVVSNSQTSEIIVIDPKKEDEEAYLRAIKEINNGKVIYVIDTHTHADHISCAARISEKFSAPLVMAQSALSKKVDIRICRSTSIYTQAGSIHCLLTPGHTVDGITLFWGPFLFTGDTILYGDTGRDDLPTGDPVAHYESLVEIKKYAKSEMIFFPGHENKGGRSSSWVTQLKVNSSLTQDRQAFIVEAGSFRGKSPEHLKEALFENLK